MAGNSGVLPCLPFMAYASPCCAVASEHVGGGEGTRVGVCNEDAALHTPHLFQSPEGPPAQPSLQVSTVSRATRHISERHFFTLFFLILKNILSGVSELPPSYLCPLHPEEDCIHTCHVSFHIHRKFLCVDTTCIQSLPTGAWWVESWDAVIGPLPYSGGQRFGQPIGGTRSLGPRAPVHHLSLLHREVG